MSSASTSERRAGGARESRGSAALSVVVASVNGFPYIGGCLDALRLHCPSAEVIVADWTDEETRRRVREGWPGVRLISFDGPMSVPELRAAGMAAAAAPHVAVIEDHCLVRDGWEERILAAHEDGHPVVGGAVHNGAPRIRDWAAFLCEYSEHMDPMTGGPAETLVGMNVSYDRSSIAAMQDLLDEGRWETWLHPHLQSRGFELHCDPEVVVDHAKDFGVREFLSQRYHYARSHAGMRNPELGWRRVIYALGSPALVPLLYARIARNVIRKRRYRGKLLAATPLMLLYLCAWALGEAVGYAFGGGRSILKVR
ncbi:MAG: glycosyltransferase [Solirubrobacterales bacterium]